MTFSKRISLVCVFTLIHLITACSTTTQSQSTSHETSPLVGAFQVHRFKLENGLRLLVVEDHSSPTFAYQTWFQVGSRNEIVGKTGLAHFFEHMMFKGTKNLKQGEFDRLLENAGAQGENAFTSRDFTAYIEEMPKNELALVARLESDRMVNLRINEEGFRTEREVVQNERRFRTENNPDGQMEQTLFELAFDTHPYHWPIIGYEKDLSSMNPSEAEAFYHNHYAPNRATIAVVGDVNPNEVFSIVKKYYGSLEPIADKKTVLTIEPTQKAARTKTLALNIQLQKLLLAYKVPGLLDQDIPAIIAMQYILAGGKSSRLQTALVDHGIATLADTYDLNESDPGLLTFIVNLQKGKTAVQAEAIMLKEFEKLAQHAPSADELLRAKNRIRFEFSQSLNSNFHKSMFIGQYETLALAQASRPDSKITHPGFELGLKLKLAIQALTPQDVKKVAKLYLNPNARTSIIGVSK